MEQEKANLCKCNNCDLVIIDQNPQIGATLHELTGKEVSMQYISGLKEKENQEQEYFWVCPQCLVDDYLIDL